MKTHSINSKEFSHLFYNGCRRKGFFLSKLVTFQMTYLLFNTTEIVFKDGIQNRVYNYYSSRRFTQEEDIFNFKFETYD